MLSDLPEQHIGIQTSRQRLACCSIFQNVHEHVLTRFYYSTFTTTKSNVFLVFPCMHTTEHVYSLTNSYQLQRLWNYFCMYMYDHAQTCLHALVSIQLFKYVICYMLKKIKNVKKSFKENKISFKENKIPSRKKNSFKENFSTPVLLTDM